MYVQLPRQISIWTDGGASGNPGPMRWGFISDEVGNIHRPTIKSFNSGDEVGTNNTAEMLGILEAMKWLEKEIFRDEYVRVVLHTDSKLAQNWIGDKWKCNFDHIQVIRAKIWEIMGRICNDPNKDVEILVKHIPREENKAHDVGGF